MALFNLRFLPDPSFLLLRLTSVTFSDILGLSKSQIHPVTVEVSQVVYVQRSLVNNFFKKKAGRLCMWSGDSLLHPLTGGCVPAIDWCYF